MVSSQRCTPQPTYLIVEQVCSKAERHDKLTVEL